MKDFIKNNLNGILGTAIFHLVLIIIVMSFKISEFIDEYEEIIIIEFPELPPPVLEKKQIDLSEIIPELKELRRTNLALNVAEEFKKQVSTEEYVKQLKEELNIKDPEEDWEKKLEEKFKIKEEKKEQQLANPDIKPDETNVTYNVKERFARYIHVPVYKCKGSATIILNITVDVKGEVVSSSVDNSLSNYVDECFVQEAMDAASRSRFNANYNAPARQKGTITYKFVAQ